MKNESTQKKHKKLDKGQVFVKVMAGILALLMLAGSLITITFALIQG